jgi:hypothetical protein
VLLLLRSGSAGEAAMALPRACSQGRVREGKRESWWHWQQHKLGCGGNGHKAKNHAIRHHRHSARNV